MLLLLACADPADTADSTATDPKGDETKNGAPILDDGDYEVVELLTAEETCGLEASAGSSWALALFTFGVAVARTDSGYSVSWSGFSAEGDFNGAVGTFSGGGDAVADGCTFTYALDLTITIEDNTTFDADVHLRFTDAVGECGATPTPCDVDVSARFAHE